MFFKTNTRLTHHILLTYQRWAFRIHFHCHQLLQNRPQSESQFSGRVEIVAIEIPTLIGQFKILFYMKLENQPTINLSRRRTQVYRSKRLRGGNEKRKYHFHLQQLNFIRTKQIIPCKYRLYWQLPICLLFFTCRCFFVL